MFRFVFLTLASSFVICQRALDLTTSNRAVLKMTVEINHTIPFVLVLVGFLIGSKSGKQLLYQLETKAVSVFV